MEGKDRGCRSGSFRGGRVPFDGLCLAGTDRPVVNRSRPEAKSVTPEPLIGKPAGARGGIQQGIPAVAAAPRLKFVVGLFRKKSFADFGTYGPSSYRT